MAFSILMRRTLSGHLAPVDDMGREVMDRVGTSGPVMVEIRKPRNVGHHRKFFALLSLIYQNQSRYKSVEELLDAMKVMLGHCIVMRLRNGREVAVPKSIAFHTMDQIAFDEFWERAVKLVCEEILPRVSRVDLEREIRDLVA